MRSQRVNPRGGQSRTMQDGRGRECKSNLGLNPHTFPC